MLSQSKGEWKWEYECSLKLKLTKDAAIKSQQCYTSVAE